MRNTGKFRHRVLIQRKTVVPGALGAPETWANVKTRWCRILTLSVQAQTSLAMAKYDEVGYSQATHEIIFRGKVTLIYNTDRFVIKGIVYEMAGVKQDPAGVGLNTIVHVKETPQNVAS